MKSISISEIIHKVSRSNNNLKPLNWIRALCAPRGITSIQDPVSDRVKTLLWLSPSHNPTQRDSIANIEFALGQYVFFFCFNFLCLHLEFVVKRPCSPYFLSDHNHFTICTHYHRRFLIPKLCWQKLKKIFTIWCLVIGGNTLLFFFAICMFKVL